jgi:hypothetical protein
LPAGSADGEVVADGETAPAGTCVETVTDDTLVCSDQYADREYAKGFCPQMQSKCGTKQKIEFTETTEAG